MLIRPLALVGNEPAEACPTIEVTSVERWLRSLRYSLEHGAPPSRVQAAELNEIFEALWSSGDREYWEFRRSAGAYFWSSPLIRRCYEKPRGYPGDFVMMDWICNGSPTAPTALGRWIDAWFSDHFPGTRSVRNRRDWMTNVLRAEHRRGARRVLNVASGGAPEFARLPHGCAFEEVVLLDQDQAALDFARQSLVDRPGAERLRTVCTKITSLLGPDGVLHGETFDVVYCMELFGYLMHDTAALLARRLFSALAPGGLLVIGNYQGSHWGRYVVEALMDWYLIYRGAPELRQLAEGLPVAGCEVKCDDTGLVLLLQLRKP